jgi:hypothetical protein
VAYRRVPARGLLSARQRASPRVDLEDLLRVRATTPPPQVLPLALAVLLGWVSRDGAQRHVVGATANPRVPAGVRVIIAVFGLITRHAQTRARLIACSAAVTRARGSAGAEVAQPRSTSSVRPGIRSRC